MHKKQEKEELVCKQQEYACQDIERDALNEATKTIKGNVIEVETNRVVGGTSTGTHIGTKRKYPLASEHRNSSLMAPISLIFVRSYSKDNATGRGGVYIVAGRYN